MDKQQFKTVREECIEAFCKKYTKEELASHLFDYAEAYRIKEEQLKKVLDEARK